MFIFLAKQNCLAQRQSPRHDSRITFAADLPKHTGINNHLTGLVDDLLSHPLVRRYLSSARRTAAFNCASEADHQEPVPVASD